MRHQWIWLCVSGLILGSMVNCGPGAPFAPGDTGIILPTLAPAAKPATVAEPTEPQRETSVPISPTQVITDKKAASEPQLWTVVPLFPTQIPTEKRPVSSTPLALPSESTEIVKLAMQDLAQRLGVSVDSITVVAVIGQDFSTDAFYCRTTKERIARDPAPELISGQTILLSASGRRYEYHASGQTVIFCRPLS